MPSTQGRVAVIFVFMMYSSHIHSSADISLTSCVVEYQCCVTALSQLTPHAVNVSKVLRNTEKLWMFRAHGRLIIFKEFIKAASGAAQDSRSEFELSKSFFVGRQCHIPPRLHFSVTGEGLVAIKSIHYGKCRLIAWHFSSVEAEMSELLNLSVLWVWCSGWRHRCLSQFNSTSSAVMADQRGESLTASRLSRRPADKQPLVSEQALCLCSRRASKLPSCACLCVF